MPDEPGVAGVERGVLRRRAQWPFATPRTCSLRPLPPPARVRMGAAACAAAARGATARPTRTSRPRVDRALHGPGGLARGLGAAAARQVRRARRRHRDGLAVEQAAPCAAPGRTRGGEARLPAAAWELLLEALAARDRGRRRARADRPPAARLAATTTGFDVTRARRARSAAATTRGLRGRRRAERYDRVLATVPNDVFAALLAPGARGGTATSAGCARRVLRRAVPAARARPPVQRRTTGPTSPTASCRSSA